MKKKKQKIEKYKVFNVEKLNKFKIIVSVVSGIVFLTLLVFAIINKVFIPATLISFSLFLFCVSYYYIEDKSKKKLVYVLFTIGVLLIVAEVIYTLLEIC